MKMYYEYKSLKFQLFVPLKVADYNDTFLNEYI